MSIDLNQHLRFIFELKKTRQFALLFGIFVFISGGTVTHFLRSESDAQFTQSQLMIAHDLSKILVNQIWIPQQGALREIHDHYRNGAKADSQVLSVIHEANRLFSGVATLLSFRFFDNDGDTIFATNIKTM
jgi:hypothetical protein